MCLTIQTRNRAFFGGFFASLFSSVAEKGIIFSKTGFLELSIITQTFLKKFS